MNAEKLVHGKSVTQKTGLVLGPVLFFVVLLFFDFDPEKPIITSMAAVAILMAVWWITEAIPLFATALLPMLLYPLLGAVFMHLFVVYYEEPKLIKRFGREYKDYLKKVPRWIPKKIKKLSSSSKTSRP